MEETYYQRNRERVLATQKSKRSDPLDKAKVAAYYREWYRVNGRNRTPVPVEVSRERNRKFPEHARFSMKVGYEIKVGRLVRPDICPRCGREARVKACYRNYERWDHFVWLCASCHKKEHLHKLPVRDLRGV